MKSRRWTFAWAWIVSTVVLTGCAKAPPHLTPEATRAFHGTQVVKTLDVMRDAAVAANVQVPPLLSTDATRKVVLYHQSVVKVIQAAPAGWVPFAQRGLEEMLDALPPKERAVVGPYAALVKTVIAEVIR